MNNLTANARRISVSLLVNYKAVKTVSLVCWVFVISYLPMLVYYEFKDRLAFVKVTLFSKHGQNLSKFCNLKSLHKSRQAHLARHFSFFLSHFEKF